MQAIKRTTRRQSPHGIHSAGKYRPIFVELAPPFDRVGFRLKGTRTTYHLPVDWLYREAMRAELARQRDERRKARKAKQ